MLRTLGLIAVSVCCLTLLLEISKLRDSGPRTLVAAELDTLFGGQSGPFANECCSDVSGCPDFGEACGDNTVQGDCTHGIVVHDGNRNVCSSYQQGASCTQGANYDCADYWSCIWSYDDDECWPNVQSFPSKAAPSSCSPTCNGM